MIPRLTDTSNAGAALWLSSLTEFRVRGFEGDLSRLCGSDGARHRQFDLPVTPEAVVFPRNTTTSSASPSFGDPVSLSEGRPSRRWHRHQRPVADRRDRGRPLAPHERDPRDQRRGSAGLGAAGCGEGSAERGPATMVCSSPRNCPPSNRATIGGMIPPTPAARAPCCTERPVITCSS